MSRLVAELKQVYPEFERPNVRLYNADCIDVMRGYSDNYFDWVIADPPYGIGEDVRDRSGTKADGRYVRQNIIDGDRWDSDPPTQDYFDEAFRVSRNQLFFGCNNYEFTQKKTSPARLVWDKVNHGCDYSDGEIAWLSVGKRIHIIPYMWNGMLQGKSLSQPYTQQGNKQLNERRVQLCHKPVLLYRGILERLNITQSAEELGRPVRILDTHSGGCSSVLAYIMAGAHVTACEIHEARYQRGKMRVRSHLAQGEFAFAKTPNQQSSNP